MAFQKATQLLELRDMVSARHLGVTLDEVMERFRCSKRTAQRMLQSLEGRFAEVSARLCEDGRKRWRVEGGGLKDLVLLSPEDLAALEHAIAAAEREGAQGEARALRRLSDKLVSLMPAKSYRRIEPDLDALLEAQGFVARPGPRPKVDEAVTREIAHAIKGCLVLDILYRGHKDADHQPRQVMPYGVLTGLRRYLVARPVDDPDGPARCYRIEGIRTAAAGNRGFARPEGFDLDAFARRAFGVYQDEREYGEVVWRFLPAAAAQARGFLFHPDQTLEDQPDGSLLVRFHAAGHLEMCWHLYTWGDKVEVLAPERLRGMVEGYRRGDFPALP
jgi:predicted DNA-binding transcriptional regulator YafY